MSVALTFKYKSKIAYSRVILSNQTWICEGMKAPQSGEHSDFLRGCYPTWPPRDQTLHLPWQANFPEASELSEGFCCDHGNLTFQLCHTWFPSWQEHFLLAKYISPKQYISANNDFGKMIHLRVVTQLFRWVNLSCFLAVLQECERKKRREKLSKWYKWDVILFIWNSVKAYSEHTCFWSFI